MKVRFSRRAVADLDEIASFYSTTAGQQVSALFAARLNEMIDRLIRAPESAQRVLQRPAIRVAPLLRYPYKLFYTHEGDSIVVLHIRHTSRAPSHLELG